MPRATIPQMRYGCGMNERGRYGDTCAPQKSGGWAKVAIVLAIGVGIYAFSPGARHFYKTGKLPA